MFFSVQSRQTHCVSLSNIYLSSTTKNIYKELYVVYNCFNKNSQESYTPEEIIFPVSRFFSCELHDSILFVFLRSRPSSKATKGMLFEVDKLNKS